MLSLCRASPSAQVSHHFFAAADDSDTESDSFSTCSPVSAHSPSSLSPSPSFESSSQCHAPPRKPKSRHPPLKFFKTSPPCKLSPKPTVTMFSKPTQKNEPSISESSSSRHLCAICLEPLRLRRQFARTKAAPPLLSTVGELLIAASGSRSTSSTILRSECHSSILSLPPEERLSRLPCGHTFHTSELHHWILTRCLDSAACPTCRAPLPLGTLPPWVLATSAARRLSPWVRWSLWWQGAFIGWRDGEISEEELKRLGFEMRKDGTTTPRNWNGNLLSLNFPEPSSDMSEEESENSNRSLVPVTTPLRAASQEWRRSMVEHAERMREGVRGEVLPEPMLGVQSSESFLQLHSAGNTLDDVDIDHSIRELLFREDSSLSTTHDIGDEEIFCMENLRHTAVESNTTLVMDDHEDFENSSKSVAPDACSAQEVCSSDIGLPFRGIARDGPLLPITSLEKSLREESVVWRDVVDIESDEEYI